MSLDVDPDAFEVGSDSGHAVEVVVLQRIDEVGLVEVAATLRSPHGRYAVPGLEVPWTSYRTFLEGLAAWIRDLRGRDATFEAFSGLTLRVAFGERGHAEVHGEISSPGGPAPGHSKMTFAFETDQAHLGRTLRQVGAIAATLPS